jgi:hypothetical protein
VEQSFEARAAAELAVRNGASIVPPGSAKKSKGNRMPEAVQPPVK